MTTQLREEQEGDLLMTENGNSHVQELLDWADRLGFRLRRRGDFVEIENFRPKLIDFREIKAWNEERRRWKERSNEIWRDVKAALPDEGAPSPGPPSVIDFIRSQTVARASDREASHSPAPSPSIDPQTDLFAGMEFSGGG